MRRFNFSSTSRRVMAAGIALVATSTSACSDAATAPKTTAAIPTAESGLIIKNLFVTATVNIVDIWGQTINEPAFVRFKTSPTDSMNVMDNSSKDLDPAVGIIKVALVLSSSYTACAVGDTYTFQAPKNPDPAYPTCSSAVAQLGKVNFGKVYMRRKPKLGFTTQDKQGLTIVGATVQVTFPNGYVHTVADGQLYADQTGAVDGKILMQLGTGPGEYKWCEVQAPTGFALANPTCGTFTAQYDANTEYVLKHKQLGT